MDKINPRSEFRMRRLFETGVLPNRSHLRDTLAGIEAHLRANPGDRTALLSKARIRLSFGELQPAENILRMLVANDPKDHQAIQELVKVLDASGNHALSSKDIAKAYCYYQEASVHDRSAVAAHRLLERAIIIGGQTLKDGSIKFLFESDKIDELTLALRRLIDEKMTIDAVLTDDLFNIYASVARRSASAGDARGALRNFDEAVSLKGFDAVLRDDPKIVREKAQVLFELGMFQESYEYLKLYIEVAQADISAFILFGNVCLKFSERADEARDAFDRALQVDRWNKDAIFGIGQAYLKLGYFKPAITHLSMVRKSYANAEKLYWSAKRLAPLFDKAGDLKGEDLKDLSPDDLLLLGSSLRRRSFWRAAEECWKVVLEKDPTHSEAMIMISGIHMGNGRFEDAERMLARLFEADRDNTIVFSRLLRSLKEQGKEDEIIRLIGRELDRKHTPEIFLKAAFVLREMGVADIARVFFEKVLELDEEDHVARIKLIRLLIADKKTRGTLRDALFQCEYGMQIAPTLLGYRYERGTVLLAMKRYKEGIAGLKELDSMIQNIKKKGVETISKRLWTRMRIADAYFDLDEMDQCRIWLDKAWELPIVGKGSKQMINKIEEKWFATMKMS